MFEHVEALIKKGALIREPNKARSLSIAEGIAVPDESRPLRFPLVGKIAAGYPIEKVAEQDELDVVNMLGPRAGRSSTTFALKVTGDSMRDEGILDGDFILCERTDVASNGERVVALLPDGQNHPQDPFTRSRTTFASSPPMRPSHRSSSANAKSRASSAA